MPERRVGPDELQPRAAASAVHGSVEVGCLDLDRQRHREPVREDQLADEGDRSQVRAREDHTLALLVGVGDVFPALDPQAGDQPLAA